MASPVAMAMRPLHKSLTLDEERMIQSLGLKTGITQHGRVVIWHPNGHKGEGSSIGQALDDLKAAT